MTSQYQLLKMLHIFGAILFIGNIIVTRVWKTIADRTQDVRIVAFGQRLVIITDFIFTGGGAALVFITGFLMAFQYYNDFLMIKWIAWGLGLFMISTLIWLTTLIPIQIKQSQLARRFSGGGEIPDEYWRLGRLWMILGSIATILPLINLYFMVFKPT